MHILVATGGSQHSEIAVKFAALLMTRPADLLTILTVTKRKGDQLQARTHLSRATNLISRPGLQIATRIRLGHPAEEIVREAEEGNYGLVVVGEREHHTLMTRFLLGSTAKRVVEHAPVPVIIAKGMINPVHRVLLCDSGIEQPSLVSRFNAQTGDLINGRIAITILHVMSQMSAGPGIAGYQLRADAAELIAAKAPEGELLARDARALTRLEISPEMKVRHGRVVEEILSEAHDGDFDLVVIGAYRGEGWRRIILDDLAHQIITQMDRPVLVIR